MEVKPEITAELIDASAAAAICGFGRTKWFNLTAAGRNPAPIKIGRSTRWRRSEIESWIQAGCPARKRWEQIRGQ